MKTSKTLRDLIFACMASMITVSAATAQITPKEMESVRANLNNHLVDGQEAKISVKEIEGLGSADAKTVKKWLKDFTVSDTALKFLSVEYGQQGENGEMVTGKDYNVRASARLFELVDLDRARKTKFHTKGDKVPIYLYNKNDGTERPYIVMSYELGGDGSKIFSPNLEKRQNAQAKGGEPRLAEKFVPIDQSLAEQPEQQEEPVMEDEEQSAYVGQLIKVDGTTYTRLANDADGNPVYVPFNQFVTSAKPTPQQGERTASVTRSISESGDPGLIAKMDQYGQQDGGQAQAGSHPADDVKYWYREEKGLDGKINKFKRNPETGVWELQEPDHQVVTLKPNQALLDENGAVELEERKREFRKVKRLYDLEENAPTEGSASAVASMNGGGGVVVGGVGYQSVWQNGAWVTVVSGGNYGSSLTGGGVVSPWANYSNNWSHSGPAWMRR